MTNEFDGVVAFTCGPSRPGCKCRCPEGDCGHKWDGPTVELDEGLVVTSSCSKCGMTAIDHDLWVAP